MEQLQGTNALVTGAAGGLGHAIARALAAERVNLVLSDLPDTPFLDDLAEELRERGVRVETVTADLTERSDYETLVYAPRRRWGRSTSWSTTPASSSAAPSSPTRSTRSTRSPRSTSRP